MTILIDRKALKEEYGFGSGVADKIFSKLRSEHRTVRPEGMRRVFVYREDAQRIIDSWTT